MLSVPGRVRYRVGRVKSSLVDECYHESQKVRGISQGRIGGSTKYSGIIC